VEYRQLGRSGLKVSELGLGTNQFGRRVGLEGVAAIMDKAQEIGVNFIDTADGYGGGLSEEYIGQALQSNRKWWLLATKVSGAMGEGPNDRGNSRKHIMDGVEASLRRLGTDYIDLYQIHFWDNSTPMEETVRTLDDLVHQGKVRYIGCSNFTAWQLVESVWTSRSKQLDEFVSVQPSYNLFNREIEKELIPAAQRYGVGIIPYSPLAGGFLTGKYHAGEAPPEGTRYAAMAGRPGMANRVLNDRNFARVDKLKAFADERAHGVGELAIAWLSAQPMVGPVICGATGPEQVEENAKATEWKLTAADLKALGEIIDAPDF
jgi:aryl-alcohol dehydrogenase-like predicted oxidoreductase